MAKKYLFKFSDGHEIYLGNNASEYCDDYTARTGAYLIYNGFRNKMLSISHTRTDRVSGDGFKPHYNKTLGKYFHTARAYEKEAKKQGYQIAGNEPPPQYTPKETKIFDDKTIKSLNEKGVKISDNEAKKLKDIG